AADARPVGVAPAARPIVERVVRRARGYRQQECGEQEKHEGPPAKAPCSGKVWLHDKAEYKWFLPEKWQSLPRAPLTMRNPVLVEALRGPLVESRHSGAAAIVDADGHLVLSLGSIERPIYPRSAIKAL